MAAELHFAELETAVEQRVLDGQPLEQVAAFIECQTLTEEEKAALWLVARIEEEPEPARPRPTPASDFDAVHD